MFRNDHEQTHSTSLLPLFPCLHILPSHLTFPCCLHLHLLHSSTSTSTSTSTYLHPPPCPNHSVTRPTQLSSPSPHDFHIILASLDVATTSIKIANPHVNRLAILTQIQTYHASTTQVSRHLRTRSRLRVSALRLLQSFDLLG